MVAVASEIRNRRKAQRRTAGLIQHFLHERERKSKELVLIDYIPRKRKHGLLDRGDSVLVFDGLYRVRIYRLVATATADTLPEAKRAALSLRRS